MNNKFTLTKMSRREFLGAASAVALVGLTASLAACKDDKADNGENASEGSTANTGPITLVFLPDSSSTDMSASRDAIAEAIKAATGREGKIMTTTDYNVAIEAIASDNVEMGLYGAEGYIQANRKNSKVQAAFTQSDVNGSLDLACYYSRICVRVEDVDEYRSGSGFTLQPLKGKSFSFVSATSTSGFKVPAAKIVDEFGLEDSDVLLENGAFFSEVLLGGSHQGSLLNLVSGDAEAAAFDDTDVDMYLDLVSGEPNMPGSIYQVRDGIGDPFTRVYGEQFIILSSTPVLNAPFAVNENLLTSKEIEALVSYFCSEAVSGDPRIFGDPDNKDNKALFSKKSPETCFVRVTDSWYDPLRILG